MVKFTHYLVTRFNVPVENWNKDKSGHPTLDGSWMRHRLNLFTRYCVPTIAGQTEKNFHWVIYCDVNTFSIDKIRIEESISSVHGAEVRLASDHAEMLSDLKKLISSHAAEYVITSRLDNDDGLGKNYIQIMQEHFREKDKWLLNPLDGIYYDYYERVMTYMRKSEKNHYTSLIEKNNNTADLKTVLGFPHDDPSSGIHIENIHGERLWLKIIHEKNVKSLLRGRPVFTKEKVYFDGIDRKEFPISFSNTVKYTFRRILQKL